MPSIVKVQLDNGVVLTCADVHWTCEENPSLANVLNHDIQTGVANKQYGHRYIPNLTRAEAMRVANEFRGHIISEQYDPPPPPPAEDDPPIFF